MAPPFPPPPARGLLLLLAPLAATRTGRGCGPAVAGRRVGAWCTWGASWVLGRESGSNLPDLPHLSATALRPKNRSAPQIARRTVSAGPPRAPARPLARPHIPRTGLRRPARAPAPCRRYASGRSAFVPGWLSVAGAAGGSRPGRFAVAERALTRLPFPRGCSSCPGPGGGGRTWRWACRWAPVLARTLSRVARRRILNEKAIRA